MKVIRIPFSLEEYQKGSYEIETRGDEDVPPQKVRILCNDLLGSEETIAAAILDGDKEELVKYSPNGKYYESGYDSVFDLFLVKQETEDSDIKVSKVYMDNIEESDMPSTRRMRYELAKAAMQGGLSNSNETMVEMDITKVTSMAIRFADKMIKELKKTSNKYELG